VAVATREKRREAHVVEAVLGRERRERREQVLAQRAADAAVLQLDHLLLLMQHATAPHQLRVNIHRSHVVHYHRDTVASAVVQHVIEKRRLASAKEAGEHCHRKRAGAAGRTHDLRGLANHRIRVRGLPRSTCHSSHIPLVPPLLDCRGLNLGCHHSFDSSPRFSSRSLSMRRDPSGLSFSLGTSENHAVPLGTLTHTPGEEVLHAFFTWGAKATFHGW